MSTDLYGVRVLGLFPAERRVRLRVFVVYYDVQAHYHQPLPDDPSFFFCYLCSASDRRYQRGGPLGDIVSVEQWLDEAFVDANAWRFVEQVTRVRTRNDPVADWSRYHDFYYDRRGRWLDEDTLVQADYDVIVTDARWLEPLVLGASAGTTSYPTRADRLRADEAARLPDLRRAPLTITPFPDRRGEAGAPRHLAFSDDGRCLAVTSDAGEVVFYDVAAGFVEDARVDVALSPFAELGWAPGARVLLQRDGATSWAYDLDAGAVVDSPPWPGRARSGRHRVLAFGEDHTILLDGHAAIDVGFVVEAAAFAGDQLLVAGMSPELVVVDPERATILRRFPVAPQRIRALAASPDATHVAFVDGALPHVGLLRLADAEVILAIPVGAPYPTELAWSPDGQHLALLVVTDDMGHTGQLRVFPAGIPALPIPAHVTAPPDEAPPPSVDPALIQQVAKASAPPTADEWRALLHAHATWLDTGGGDGDGGLPDSPYYRPPWKTLSAAGLTIAQWGGPAGTDGTQACLRMRSLAGVSVARARLAWADLTAIHAPSLDLADADLRGVSATDAFLPQATFRAADLRMADFSRSNLRGADFTAANLEACDFQAADLTGATFTGARIGGINLAGARLDGIVGFGDA